MEFWGVEVKSGETLVVKPGKGMVLHLSQVCLSEVKKDKGNESVCLFLNIDGKKLVLGTLYSEKLAQQIFDLIFDRDFALSHNWKHGNVFFYGYRAHNPYQSESEGDSESESEEDSPRHIANNGVSSAQAKQDKPSVVENTNALKDSEAGKQKVKTLDPSIDLEPADDTSDEADAMSEDDSEDDEDGEDGSDEDDDDEDEDDDDSDEDEETSKKVEPSKKRAIESATKTLVPDKKAKFVTPQKTDGKKGSGHVATPHPSKQAGKKPVQQTPKSGGSLSCKACNRSFNSENALNSHNKAKHSAGK